MPEIRAVQLGFLADAVDAQHHIPPGGLLEGQPGVGTQRGGAEVHGDGHHLVGLVAAEHLVEQSLLLEVVAGQPELAQFLPVDHGLVVTVPGLLAAVRGGLLHCFICLFHFFLILWVDTLVFLVPRDNLILFQKFLHGLCLFSGGYVLDGLSDFRVVQRLLLDGDDAEAGRVLELAPEIFQEVLEHAGVAVDFQKGVPVLPVCRNGPEAAVLLDTGHGLQNQFHLVEDEHDVAHLLVLGGLRYGGSVPHVFLCHNFCFLGLINVAVGANIYEVF